MIMDMNVITNMNINMNISMDMNTYGHWSITLLAKHFGGSNLRSSSGGIVALLCLHNQK